MANYPSFRARCSATSGVAAQTRNLLLVVAQIPCLHRTVKDAALRTE